MKKTLLSLLAVIIIFTSTGPVLANNITIDMPYSIYESVEKNVISSGVVYEKIMRFNANGWWNINVLRVNLIDPFTEVRGLISPNGVANRDRISSLVEKNNAIAGINADFFYSGKFTGPIGALIENSYPINIPRDDAVEKLPGFFIDFLNKAKVDNFNRQITVTNKDTGNKVNVNAVNNVTGHFNAITMLNRYWGEKSIGNTYDKDLIEIFVDDGIVIDKRIGDNPIDIPVNGYVLIGNGPRAQGLLDFSIGDPVDLNISSTPDINDIKFSIGGGNIILKNGEIPSLDPKSAGDPKGNHPRTGIGISKDGSEIILVTIDGRDTSFKGVSQEMFGAVLRNLGAYNAINLDGGGSTTMALKPIGESKATVVNKPSDGSERLVINGVGVFSNAPVSELAYIKLSTDDTNMFVGTTRKLTVKGYDKYHNPVSLNEENLAFTLNGVEGEFLGNIFKPSSIGKAKIEAKYDNIVSSLDLNVLGNVKDLSTNLTSFTVDINSEKALPIFYGKDENGHKAKIYPEDITFTNINNIGRVENGTFYSGETSVAGALTAKFGEGVRNILVYVGNDGKLLEGFETLDNLRFTVYPETVLGELMITSEAKEGNASATLKYDFSLGENSRAAYLKLSKDGSPGIPIDGIPKKLGLWVKGDNNGSWLRGTIKDKEGNLHKIDFAKTINWTGWQLLTTNLPTTISYPISLEDIYVVETDSLKKHSGEISFDGLNAFYLPTIGNVVLPTPSTLKDSKNINAKINKDSFSFAVVMEPKGLNELVKYDALSKVQSRINKHKMVLSLNGLSEKFGKGLTTQEKINASGKYGKSSNKGILFLNINTEKGGIRPTNPEQWNMLISDLNNAAENNIVLSLTSPVFGSNGFNDVLEGELLHKHLVQAKEKGKNIFVVHGGNTNTLELKDGIRYIGINTKTLTNPEDIYNLSIVEFVLNGSDITYEVNPFFEKPNIKVKP